MEKLFCIHWVVDNRTDLTTAMIRVCILSTKGNLFINETVKSGTSFTKYGINYQLSRLLKWENYNEWQLVYV